MTTRWLLVAALAVTALAGCSTSNEGNGSTSSETTETTAVTTTESPPTTTEGGGGEGAEGPGSLSHAEDGKFCESHTCIENFPYGHGTVVECSDGEWSHSGGISGACSDHGGEAGGGGETTPEGGGEEREPEPEQGVH
jgi:hypothetical protein